MLVHYDRLFLAELPGGLYIRRCENRSGKPGADNGSGDIPQVIGVARSMKNGLRGIESNVF